MYIYKGVSICTMYLLNFCMNTSTEVYNLTNLFTLNGFKSLIPLISCFIRNKLLLGTKSNRVYKLPNYILYHI